MTRQGVAPRVAAAASTSSGKVENAVVIMRMTKGKRDHHVPEHQTRSVAVSRSGVKASRSASPDNQGRQQQRSKEEILAGRAGRGNRPWSMAKAAGTPRASDKPVTIAAT